MVKPATDEEPTMSESHERHERIQRMSWLEGKVEYLETENARLREALEAVIRYAYTPFQQGSVLSTARAALEGADDGYTARDASLDDLADAVTDYLGEGADDDQA